MMKRLLIISCLFATIALAFPFHRKPALRCRVITVTGDKVKRGAWREGTDGCKVLMNDAKFAMHLFGDVTMFKMQIQSAGETQFIRLSADSDSAPSIPDAQVSQ